MCADCSTLNKPEASICGNQKCRLILSREAYFDKQEEAKRAKKEIAKLRDGQEALQRTIKPV
jgi:hypothetical protein